MSTEAENAQAAAEGYWPLTHGYEYIDAHAVKTMVKDFIAKNPAPKMPGEAVPPIAAASPSDVLTGPKASAPSEEPLHFGAEHEGVSA